MTNAPAILLISASALRRTRLQKSLSAIWPHGAIMAGSTLTQERMEQSGAEILLVDVESHAQADALLRFVSAAESMPATVVLADEPDPSWARRIIANGANAIIARDSSVEDIRLAIEAAQSGFVLLHPSSARMLIPPAVMDFDLDSDSEIMEHLTSREREILRLMGSGLGNREIAVRLGISEHTVKFHASSILGKMGASSRTEAVSRGIRRGLISI